MNSCFPLLSYLLFSRQISASVCVLAWSRTGGQNRRGGGHFLSICDIFGFHFANLLFLNGILFRITYIMLTMPRVRARARPRRRVSGRGKRAEREQKNLGRSIYLALPGCGLQQGGNEDLSEVIAYQYTTSSQPSKITRRPFAIDTRSPGS